MLAFIDREFTWKETKLADLTIPEGWEDAFLEGEIEKISEYLSHIKARVYPSPDLVFRAFYEVAPTDLNLVVLGQDPYHNGNATGLCFDVKSDGKINPSLRNIYKELESCEYGISKNGDLSHWPKSGVLMLNSALTVEKSSPDAHSELWSDFTRNIISWISKNLDSVHWLLMGGNAISFRSLILNPTHKIFITSHPSPFSAYRNTKNSSAFIGSNIFKKINESLKFCKKFGIKW